MILFRLVSLHGSQGGGGGGEEEGGGGNCEQMEMKKKATYLYNLYYCTHIYMLPEHAIA